MFPVVLWFVICLLSWFMVYFPQAENFYFHVIRFITFFLLQPVAFESQGGWPAPRLDVTVPLHVCACRPKVASERESVECKSLETDYGVRVTSLLALVSSLTSSVSLSDIFKWVIKLCILGLL